MTVSSPDSGNTDTQTYPYNGTCDGCAEGPKDLREVDPETQAWICQQCDEKALNAEARDV